MHELSLAGGVLQLVEDAQRREGFVRVQRLVLEAGALSGVDVAALRFALDAVSPGSCLQGADIVVEQPAAPAWCLGCGQAVTLHDRLDACPLCGSHRLQPSGGTELRVRELLVHDAHEPVPTPHPDAAPTPTPAPDPGA